MRVDTQACATQPGSNASSSQWRESQDPFRAAFRRQMEAVQQVSEQAMLRTCRPAQPAACAAAQGALVEPSGVAAAGVWAC